MWSILTNVGVQSRKRSRSDFFEQFAGIHQYPTKWRNMKVKQEANTNKQSNTENKKETQDFMWKPLWKKNHGNTRRNFTRSKNLYKYKKINKSITLSITLLNWYKENKPRKKEASRNREQQLSTLTHII